jgi:predicted transcriptional regulator
MYKANLSYTQLNEYLKFLLTTNLIAQTIVEGKEVYKITPQGLNFLLKHNKLIHLLKTKKT